MNDGVVIAALKALSNETKALIMVSELGARRMPSFQLRTIFNAILKDEDERRIVVDLIDKELQASGFPEDQVFSLLNDLLTAPAPLPMNDSVQNTRRLRSPFAQNFEAQMPAQIGAGLAPAGSMAPMGGNQFASRVNFAGAPSSMDPQQTSPSPGAPQFAKPTPNGEEAPRNYAPTQRTGSFPSLSAQGFPMRGGSVREAAPLGGPGLGGPGGGPGAPRPSPPAGEQRNGQNTPVPATQRYTQNAFHNPEDNPERLPAKPYGFQKNSFSSPETPPQTPGLPGFPGMPPVTVRATQQGPGMPAAAPTQRRFGNDTRLTPTASAQAVSEAALLTPGLANISAPLASKIVSRTDGSPNNFQSGTNLSGRNNDGRPVILLADDDKRIRMVFRLRMEEAGLNVVEASDGTEAWERIQQGDVSLAVLDMKMPGLHGLEVLSRMADKQCRIPVIVCSAYDQLKDEFVVQTYPRLRYLVKPVAPEQLVGSIKELLQRAQSA